MTRNRTPAVAALLFSSGLCALVYQTVWLRQFRLIFGASTFATAAVLAIFMAGLGLGSAILGRRADAHRRPLLLYAQLELLIAATAAISPLLLWLVAKVYVALGGSTTLGLAGASLVRLLLATLILAAPTFLMGGTLPAAARAVETSDDDGRRKLALLYAANTLGAVTGTLLSTFYALETFGNRRTLFIAVLLNLLVGVAARALAREMPDAVDAPREEEPAVARQVPAAVVLAASGIVGFAFLLMELVWYRLLAPLLGGTTFTFGLILAIALAGIGLGGLGYSARGRAAQATVGGFALTCSLEALAVIVPFALGDRLALLASSWQAVNVHGFGATVMMWTLLCGIVVFPAAFIAGVQFPMLIALLGRGSDDVGRHVGSAYAWNTVGAIAGSLAGGFGLLPLLTAPGAWRLVAILLAATGIGAIVYALRARQVALAMASLVAAVLALAGTFSTGPTAVWRHSGIGAGRAPRLESPNELRQWIQTTRRTTIWEADGLESSVALANDDDLAFIVNGKSDGAARGDAPTQVMGGLIGAALHPHPKTAFVIGLGTGSTAGWLADVPTMQRVDVAELEPSVLHVAEMSAAVNRNVLRHPKVRIDIADARELLLTTRNRYDIIFSEPSNPYRAGIASLFTTEFYAEAARRLNEHGIFLQWVQTYDIDAETVQTIYATIVEVFPHVETWRTAPGDLVLVATREPLVVDMTALRRRLASEPLGPAAHVAWRVEDAEGFLSHFVASSAVSRAIAEQAVGRNTDDRTLIEFGFARRLGDMTQFRTDRIIEAAHARNGTRPAVRGAVDWQRVDAHRATEPALETRGGDPHLRTRRAVAFRHRKGELAPALSLWRANPWPAVNTAELSQLAELLAESGSDDALPLIEHLRRWQPIEADAILARLRLIQRRHPEAAALLERALVRYRTDPWPGAEVMQRALESAVAIGRAHPQLAARMDAALSEPFAARQLEDHRRLYRFVIAATHERCGERTLAALNAMEPHVPWRVDVLRARVACANRAEHDLATYVANEPAPLIP